MAWIRQPIFHPQIEHSRRGKLRWFRISLPAAFCFVLLTFSLSGQESIRPSLAGDTVERLQKPSIDRSNYDLMLGPVLVDFTSSLQLEFNDNISLSEHHRESDFIFRPFLNANVLWQLSSLNSLQLDLGIGYNKYFDHSEFDTSGLLIAPRSQLAFNIYVGDFRINLFDQFSIEQNPVDQINLSRIAKFQRFENSAGLSVTWDLNQLVIVGGYVHYLFKAIDSQFDFMDRNEEQFFLSAAFKVSDMLTIGIRGTGGLLNWDHSFQSDGSVYSVGPFAEAHLTRYLDFSLEGGYQGAQFDFNPNNRDNSQLANFLSNYYSSLPSSVPQGNRDTSNLSSYYVRLTLSNRMNRYWVQTLSVGHEADIGLTTNYTEVAFVRYRANWRVNSRLNCELHGSYEHGVDSPGFFQSENVDWYSAGFNFDYRLGRHASMSIGYDYVKRDSDLAERSYYQNRVLWTIRYEF
jgi:Putative beta-barrel porin 2